MDDKIKNIIMIALGVFMIASLGALLQVSGAKKITEQELGYAKAENEALNKKLEDSRKETKQLQEKMDQLTAEINKTAAEKDDLQKRYDDIKKQYDTLAQDKAKVEERLKLQEGALPHSATEERSYWADLIKEKSSLELQIKTLKAANEQLKSDNSSLNMNLSNLLREKQDLQEQFQYHQKMLDNVASEFIWEKNARFRMQDKFIPIKNENSFLRRQLKNLTTSKDKLNKKVEELTQDKDALQRQLSELELFLKDKLASLGESRYQAERLLSSSPQSKEPLPQQFKKESVELPPIVVRPQSETPAADEGSEGSFLFGNVLSVNENNNFVVINIGEDAGVRTGQKFQVFRGEDVIAVIQAIQVRKNISACDIKKQSLSVKVGDKVK